MVSALISRVIILVFGTLYPAYSSYKAVKTKNVKEYVKWMMYWIVFALFTTVETFADVLISWFPFYYELKIAFVIWLLSPATKGSSILYRKFVHPELLKREGDIDETLEKVKTQGYSALVNVGQQGINLAVQSAITGQHKMLDHIMKKSFSMGDISQQQSQAARVTYTPVNEKIPEVRDEPDVSQPMTSGIPEQFMYNELQGGDKLQGGDEKRDVEKEEQPKDEHIPRGYNLRSHEYHGAGATDDLSARQNYHHSQGYHYGTLPRRAASVRSNVNTALPSRWRKSTAQ